MMSYNMDFLAASLVLLVLILYHFLRRKRLRNVNNRIFEILILVGILDIVFDIITTILMCRADGKLVVLTKLSLTFFYILQDIISVAPLFYTQSLRDVPTEKIKKSIVFWSVPAVILGIVIVTNYWTGIFFYFDEAGLYHKGTYYLTMYIFALVYVTILAISSVVYYKELGFAKFTVIWEFMLIEGICVLIQAMWPRMLMTGFGIGLSITVLYLTLNNPYGFTDNLTGVFDKSSFDRWMQEQIIRKNDINLITVDLYKLKRINKVFGQSFGDKVLIFVTQIMQQIMESEHIFRITGNRFLIITNSLTDYEKVRNSLLRFFKEDMRIDGETLHFPAIICGITDAAKLGESDVLLQYVEYLASLSPDTNDTILIQDDERTMRGFRYEEEVERFLNTAIEHDLFEVQYQLIYSTETGDYVTMEALSRLRHPNLGPISPEVFISVAERSGQIADIGYLQFRRVCRFIHEHEEIMDKIEKVKFNLSPLELLKQGQSKMLINVIREFDLPFSFFQFEITETVATEYSDNLYRVVSEFINNGIGLSLDDFGSGYANLNTVLKLPFSSIKIDRSLLSGICEDKQVAVFYQNIVSILQNMGYDIISEGVETREQVELLSGWGVDMLQGYYFAKPLDEKELLQTLFQKEK